MARRKKRYKGALDTTLAARPMVRAHPKIIDTGLIAPDGLETGDHILRCPQCGGLGTIDDYDCLGADEDCVFCNGCNAELAL